MYNMETDNSQLFFKRIFFFYFPYSIFIIFIILFLFSYECLEVLKHEKDMYERQVCHVTSQGPRVNFTLISKSLCALHAGRFFPLYFVHDTVFGVAKHYKIVVKQMLVFSCFSLCDVTHQERYVITPNNNQLLLTSSICVLLQIGAYKSQGKQPPPTLMQKLQTYQQKMNTLQNKMKQGGKQGVTGI